MGDQGGKVEKAFEEWRRAEEQYAEAVAAFGSGGPPSKVKKDSAVELAKLRRPCSGAPVPPTLIPRSPGPTVTEATGACPSPAGS